MELGLAQLYKSLGHGLKYRNILFIHYHAKSFSIYNFRRKSILLFP